MRIMLELNMGQASSTLYPGHRHFVAQAFVSANYSEKRSSLAHSKSRHALVLSGKTNIQFEKIHSDPIKAHEKEKNSNTTSNMRTLKEHLHQCPSKLSEEMVKCKAAVYSGLRSAASANSKKK